MFKRHRSDPDREIGALVRAFHDRLAGSMAMTRTASPRIDPGDLRGRLGAPVSGGLRDRIDRRLGAA